MKKGKLDFLVNVADTVRSDVNKSNETRSTPKAVNQSSITTPQPSLSPSQQPPSPPLPSPPVQKQKREVEKILTNSIEGFFAKNIEAAGVALTKEVIETLPQITEEINNGVCHVRIHPEQDIQLSILAKRLRHEHKLRGRGGISKTALIYLIVERALREVQ
jgi:hypothetical protein